MNKTIIGIMGATGTVGTELITILSKADIEIHAYTRNLNVNFKNTNV